MPNQAALSFRQAASELCVLAALPAHSTLVCSSLLLLQLLVTYALVRRKASSGIQRTCSDRSSQSLDLYDRAVCSAPATTHSAHFDPRKPLPASHLLCFAMPSVAEATSQTMIVAVWPPTGACRALAFGTSLSVGTEGARDSSIVWIEPWTLQVPPSVHSGARLRPPRVAAMSRPDHYCTQQCLLARTAIDHPW